VRSGAPVRVLASSDIRALVEQDASAYQLT
jgi:hypothetical protein